MTKKQLKTLAKKIADLEYTIQNCDDKYIVGVAKDDMLKIQESTDMALEEMFVLDEMVQKYLKEKEENI